MVLYVIIDYPRKEYMANAVQYHSCTVSLLFSFNVFGWVGCELHLPFWIYQFTVCLFSNYSISPLPYMAPKCEHPYMVLTDGVH